jgi:hypothetical protein
LNPLDAKRGRLVVNVDIFGKPVSVELDVEDVEPPADSKFKSYDPCVAPR